MSERAAPWLDDLAPAAVDEAVGLLRDAARDGTTVVIGAHVGPDGDALGAALALHLALSRAGARTLPTWGEEPLRIPPGYADLPGVDDLVRPSDIPVDEVGLFVAVDAASAERLGRLRPLLDLVPTIVVDHHATNTRFGTVDLAAPGAAATVVVVEELLRRLDVPLDRDLATCLYVGLVTDTGVFQHASTDRAALELAGRLVDAGAPHTELTRRLFGTRTLGEIGLLGRALDRAAFAPEARLIHTPVTGADLAAAGVGIEAAEAVIDVVRTADVAEVAMVAKEEDAVGPTWRVSLRSRDEVDVAALAALFGGGGHVRAAGFTAVGPYDELVGRVVAALADRRRTSDATATAGD